MAPVTSSKHLVLYADDDGDDLKFVEGAFSENTLNIELVTVEDGVEALNYLNSLADYDPNPCLIILDVNMPRMNGREVLQKIRRIARFKNTPIVLFTTSSTQQDKNFAIENAAGFVTKPFSTLHTKEITDLFIEHCDEEIRKKITRKFK